MTLSTEEITSLRAHLGYNALSDDSGPYSGDGFWFTFEQVVSPYLTTGTEDASVTAVTAGAVTTITISDATDFDVYGEAVIDVGLNAELVQIQAKTSTTLVAYFAKAHSSSGYPVATMSGKARLRLLLHDANEAWRAVTDSSVGKTAGIKSADKNDVVFFRGFRVLKDRLAHYHSIVTEIGKLIHVAPAWNSAMSSGGSVRMEAY